MMPADASSSLSIRLFGPFEARLPAGSLLRLRSRKEQWLLALLALQHGRPRERAWLAGMLWPESSQTQALANLRNCLAGLRHALGPEAHRLGSPTPRTLALDLNGTEVDVLAFDAVIARGDRPSLEQAVSLYGGPLLEDCPEAWALQARQLREQAYLQALEQLAAHAVGRGAPGEAEGYLRRAIGVDPLRESAHRALMRVLAEGGSKAAALEVYRELRLLLHRELNAAPDPETIALFQSLRSHFSHPARCAAGRTPPAHNLPGQLTRFIGREREMAEVRCLLSTARLLTLTGAGGCGKTRLALQVAAGLVDAYLNGVWLVELASLADPALVPQAVATVLRVREEPGCPLTQTLIEALRGREMLLVLDNCEHLLPACAELAEALLRTCSLLRMLATSRERLGIGGEQLYRVPSLSLPDAALRSSLEELCASEAIQLFVARARLTEPRFTLTMANAAAVAQVCHRLDGIPLAIELAAARIGALSVETQAERLNDRFRLLSAGSRTALPRHQTLRAVVEWSYELLTAPERVLFARLSVFAGGWTLDAAEAVCAGEGIDVGGVMELLAALVEKSLVGYEEQEPAGNGSARWATGPRYRLLQTIEEFGRECLAASVEKEAIRRRHALFFLGWAREWATEGVQQAPDTWWAHLEREYGNVRAALLWAVEHGEAEVGLLTAWPLGRFWGMRGIVAEGREHLTRILALPGAQSPGEMRARALLGAGMFANDQGDYQAALPLFTESLAIFRALAHSWGVAASLEGLGKTAWGMGDYPTARAMLEDALAICRQQGYVCDTADTLCTLGGVLRREGDHTRAGHIYEESRALYENLGHREALVARELRNLGHVAQHEGDTQRARRLFQKSLLMLCETGFKAPIPGCLVGMAGVASAMGQPAPGARLLGAAQSLLEAMGTAWQPDEQREYERHLAQVRSQLDEPDFETAWAAGQAMSMEQAIACALEET